MNKCLASIAALAFMAAGAAFSAPLTFNYVGTTSYGQAVSGSLTFTLDPSTYEFATSDGVTYSQRWGDFYNPLYCPSCASLQSNPLQVSGSFNAGTGPLSVGGGTVYDEAFFGIIRHPGGGNQYIVAGLSVDENFAGRYIELRVQDNLGTASEIFSDPNGGLDFLQTINWGAQGAESAFYVWDSNGVVFSQYFGVLSSVTTQAAVPEPSGLALVALALLGVGVASRRPKT